MPLAAGVQAALAHEHVSGSTIETLASNNAQYRAWQNAGIVYSREQLQGHITTIEHLLTTTLDYGSRRDLYRLLSQAQFLACGGRTNPERLTLFEKAVASAQQSGDILLLVGMLSHLSR